MPIDALNSRYAIPGQLTFKAGPGGLTIAEINNKFATATIALLGAHVLTYQPHGEAPVLFLSQQSWFEIGKPIRGGIPVCFPWFGPHPTDSNKPAHGFMRTMQWNVVETRATSTGATQIRLSLASSEATQILWDQPFYVQIAVTVAETLTVELIARNPGSRAYTVTGALHTYFHISDIADITIEGLEGCTYLDKNDGFKQKIQQGAIVFTGGRDGVVLDTSSECVIKDAGLRRRIHVNKFGSRSTVVWNPWIEKARAMPDMGDEEYKVFVCVETANAANDVITIQPGGEHRLGTIISTEKA